MKRLLMMLAVMGLLSAGLHAQEPGASKPAATPRNAAAHAAAKPVLPFIADDYAKARADAQKRNVPIFVDIWAPW